MAKRDRISICLGAIVIALELAWIGFARIAAPAVIESAYRRESFALLNDVISGRDTHPVQKYLTDWQVIAWEVATWWLVIGLGLIIMTRPEVFRIIFGTRADRPPDLTTGDPLLVHAR